MREGAAILAIGATLLPATTSLDAMARNVSASGYQGWRVRLTFANTFRPAQRFAASAADIWEAGPVSQFHSPAGQPSDRGPAAAPGSGASASSSPPAAAASGSGGPSPYDLSLGEGGRN